MGFYYRNSILPPNLQKNISPKAGFYYNNNLIYSIAYQQLRKSSRDLLYCFLTERRWSGKGKKKTSTNNGRISFTEKQFKEQGLGCSTTYIKARNQLIEHGFIIQTEKGGMCRGDRAMYKILCLEDVPDHLQRWKDYPVANWSKEIPKEKNNQVGIKSRWKKGVSGRNTKATLLKRTHNEANDCVGF